MEILDRTFDERVSQIETYLDLLAAIEAEVQRGVPRIGTDGPAISVQQQKILYSSVYLQLYNLVEATISKCVDVLCETLSLAARWQYSDLSPKLRREWVRYRAKTHSDLNYENRLTNSLSLCDHLIQSLPVDTIDIDRGGGGNWDDEEIYKFADRLGFTLDISAESSKAVKSPFRNDVGAMRLIVNLRNALAHGNVSFAECGEGVTVNELRDLKERTTKYMTEVVVAFKNFILEYRYLQEDCRPTNQPA